MSRILIPANDARVAIGLKLPDLFIDICPGQLQARCIRQPPLAALRVAPGLDERPGDRDHDCDSQHYANDYSQAGSALIAVIF